MSTEAARAIEAILMVAQEPVDPHLLAQLLEVAPAVVTELCESLQGQYEEQERGFRLVQVAGGYRFQSHEDLTAYVERFALEGQSARLSSAALETLAIVAYKQPLSRAQVAAIRGVNVDGVMRTLQQRGYIVELGRDTGPGQAALFGTSQEFLERMGLNSLDDLPPIAELFPSAEIMEALEQTLRATAEPPGAAEPAGAPEPAEADQPDDHAGEAPTPDAEPDHPTGFAPTHVVSDEPAAPIDTVVADPFAEPDELPEPELPAWAVDPPAAEGPVAGDLDGAGAVDLPPEP